MAAVSSVAALSEEPPPPQLASISSDAAARATPSCLTVVMAIPSKLANTLGQMVLPLNQNGFITVDGIHIHDQPSPS